MRSPASARARRRWRSSTTSSSARTRSSRRPSCRIRSRSSKASCRPASSGSRQASSGRRRASSRVRAAPRSTSSVLGRGCGARRPRSSSAVPRSFVREARRRVGPKKARIEPVIERLAVEHADAKIALRFQTPLELLISVMLSAQTTDVNVNKVTERLFVKYRRPEDYLAVPQEELERDIFATGFFRQKAKSLRGTMQLLIEEFGGEVPTGFDDLLRLPGVARKTANVVSAERGNAQGVVVDTHVRRLSQRLGLTKEEDPVKIERDLMKLVPRGDWALFPHLLIWHGRRICIARAPLCEECPLAADLCPSSRI